MNLDDFQNEHLEWLTRMFPNQLAWQPAAGLLEEAGELVRAVLKMSQTQMFGAESKYTMKDWQTELYDAVGDCAIFACSLCNANNWRFAKLYEYGCAGVYLDTSTKSIDVAATVVQVAIDIVRNPTSKPALVRYLCELQTFAKRHDTDVVDCIKITWPGVRDRRRPCPNCLAGQWAYQCGHCNGTGYR